MRWPKVPTQGFVTNRPAAVIKAQQEAQRIYDKVLGNQNRDKALNGFWAQAGHLGTHKNSFFLDLAKKLAAAEAGGPRAEIGAIKQIKADIKARKYL